MSSITTLFPHPLLSLLIAATWLLLAQSIAPPHLIAAALFAWGIPRLLRAILPPFTSRIRWGLALRLLAVVLYDILLANLMVARLVLSPNRRPRSAWLTVPLSYAHPRANALLAGIITMTPGTVSVAFVGDHLLVHMLDCPDPAAAVAEIQQRYQEPLARIFAIDAPSSSPSEKTHG